MLLAHPRAVLDILKYQEHEPRSRQDCCLLAEGFMPPIKRPTRTKAVALTLIKSICSATQYQVPTSIQQRNIITMKIISLSFLTTLVLAGISSTVDAASGSKFASSLQQGLQSKARKLMEKSDFFQSKARKLQDTGTFCSLLEDELTFDDLGDGAEGQCDCTGTMETAIELSCAATGVCDEIDGEYCGDFSFNIRMEGILSENPKLEFDICVDMEATWMEEMCFDMTFSGDMTSPQTCGVTYGGEDCSCTIDTVELDGPFAIDVPCTAWNCQEVVPELLKPYMADDGCAAIANMDVDTEAAQDSGLQDTAVGSLTTLESIPEDVVTELEANAGSGAMTMKGYYGAIFAVIAAAAFA
ncbi:MAG: hypothetical protein SGARI_002458 [Bacillariaceae sp.]